MRMFRRKDKVLDEPESISTQPAAHHGGAVLLYEVGEIVGIDDSFLNTGCLHNATFEPAVIDPPLHLIAAYMQGFRQAVNREPVAPSLGALAQAMQHGANGMWRALHDPGNFFHGVAFDEVEKPLLFRLCPGSPRTFLDHTMLT